MSVFLRARCCERSLTSRAGGGKDVCMPSKVRRIPSYETKDLSNELESQNKDKYPLSIQACLYMLMTPPIRYSDFLCILWDLFPNHRNKKLGR